MLSHYRPLTLSESLTRNACRIDFSRELNESEPSNGTSSKTAIKEEKEDEEIKDADRFSANLWPWDSVRNKLRDAMTEVCVLSDVLAIAKRKQYMVLDPVPQDPQTIKPIVQIFARKKALSNAANILLMGAEQLRSSQSETKNSRNVSDFHIELLRLRQNWRLKKVGSTIVGDLSYRTAGSKFPHNGIFEVTKAEDEPEPDIKPQPSTPSSVPRPNSALRVTVPSELQGVAYIKVITQKDQEDLCTAVVNLLGHGPNITHQAGIWQKSLEYAQNVLFCKELFNQLAREAVQLQAPIPHVVVGNQIRATLLSGIQLIISLCHSTSFDSASSGPITDHDHVLEHSLHQLLREVHYKNTHLPLPHHIHGGPIGPSKKRMLAGPMAADRYDLIEMTKSQTLLEQIIAQAQHIFMRKRTQYVLDTLARDVKDPQIISHWNSMNSPTMSCVKINIITYGYDTVCRSTLSIHVKERSLKCITRDGRVMLMSYEPQELRDLILCQINNHQIFGLQLVAKCMAWQTLSNSNHLGIGRVEPLGNATSCLLASPNGDRLIAVKITCDPPQIDIRVYVAQISDKSIIENELVQGKQWDQLNVNFREVFLFLYRFNTFKYRAFFLIWTISLYFQLRFERLEGKNFLNKMENLMASLSNSSLITKI